MATTERSAAPALEIRRTFASPPQRVNEAWTDPKALTRWFGPSDDFTVVVHELDLRVGGTYRIELRDPSGAAHTATGTYRELRAPHRLAFTWRWAERPEMKDTLVTIDLTARDGGTELRLAHTQFESDEDRGNHEKGWQGCLDRLSRLG